MQTLNTNTRNCGKMEKCGIPLFHFKDKMTLINVSCFWAWKKWIFTERWQAVVRLKIANTKEFLTNIAGSAPIESTASGFKLKWHRCRWLKQMHERKIMHTWFLYLCWHFFSSFGGYKKVLLTWDGIWYTVHVGYLSWIFSQEGCWETHTRTHKHKHKSKCINVTTFSHIVDHCQLHQP